MNGQAGARFDLMALMLAAVLGGCSGHSREREIITQIEGSIRLPKGAEPLSAYSRYYAARKDGVVVASYIIHPAGFKDDIARACREEIKGAPFPCPTKGGEVRLVDSGKSLWVSDPNDLPFMNDGGCAQVSVEYQPRTTSFTAVECNHRL